MRPNLRSLVAKAYRVRQGRTFSSSAPKGGSSSDTVFVPPSSIVHVVVTRSLILMAGYSFGSYLSGDKIAEYKESLRRDNKKAWDALATIREELHPDMSKS